MKYEKGGRVRISGEWYDVNRDSGSHYVQVKLPSGKAFFDLPMCFVGNYEPPPKQEWIEWGDMELAEFRGDLSTFEPFREALNTILTFKYGAPPK